ncbi:hypothetical protein ABZS66_13940 [Dactylosporangium sp. NPDC005572]|uniref:hypothetical protein n=1 Tax=Dactylosporangium sp. NPDC005572 TaxID=3156889 RepID=UPI0033B89143
MARTRDLRPRRTLARRAVVAGLAVVAPCTKLTVHQSVAGPRLLAARGPGCAVRAEVAINAPDFMIDGDFRLSWRPELAVDHEAPRPAAGGRSHLVAEIVIKGRAAMIVGNIWSP